MDECAVLAQLKCANDRYATARCRPKTEADNRVVAGGEVGYFNGTTGLPVGLHYFNKYVFMTEMVLGPDHTFAYMLFLGSVE